jgi:hypothetical protein
MESLGIAGNKQSQSYGQDVTIPVSGQLSPPRWCRLDRIFT